MRRVLNRLVLPMGLGLMMALLLGIAINAPRGASAQMMATPVGGTVTPVSNPNVSIPDVSCNHIGVLSDQSIDVVVKGGNGDQSGGAWSETQKATLVPNKEQFFDFTLATSQGQMFEVIDSNNGKVLAGPVYYTCQSGTPTIAPTEPATQPATSTVQPTASATSTAKVTETAVATSTTTATSTSQATATSTVPATGTTAATATATASPSPYFNWAKTTIACDGTNGAIDVINPALLNYITKFAIHVQVVFSDRPDQSIDMLIAAMPHQQFALYGYLHGKPWVSFTIAVDGIAPDGSVFTSLDGTDSSHCTPATPTPASTATATPLTCGEGQFLGTDPKTGQPACFTSGGKENGGGNQPTPTSPVIVPGSGDNGGSTTGSSGSVNGGSTGLTTGSTTQGTASQTNTMMAEIGQSISNTGSQVATGSNTTTVAVANTNTTTIVASPTPVSLPITGGGPLSYAAAPTSNSGFMAFAMSMIFALLAAGVIRFQYERKRAR